jgi:hypothetical protein
MAFTGVDGSVFNIVSLDPGNKVNVESTPSSVPEWSGFPLLTKRSDLSNPFTESFSLEFSEFPRYRAV